MPVDMHDLARRGAAARIAELEQEIAEIRAAFPGTGAPRQGAKRGRPPGSRTATGSEVQATAESGGEDAAPSRPRSGKKKRTMSAEARARISEAQKARWAKQKRAAK